MSRGSLPARRRAEPRSRTRASGQCESRVRFFRLLIFTRQPSCTAGTLLRRVIVHIFQFELNFFATSQPPRKVALTAGVADGQMEIISRTKVRDLLFQVGSGRLAVDLHNRIADRQASRFRFSPRDYCPDRRRSAKIAYWSKAGVGNDDRMADQA